MSSKHPFFSIITCTYNSEKYIRETINSVANQQFTDYEHIFIDGKSNDKTLSLIKSYQTISKGKVRLYTQPPKGIANAMNHGIRYSKGQYIIHLHSDDSLYDDLVLTDVYNHLIKNSQVDWVYGVIHVIESNGKTIGYFPKLLPLRIGWKYLLKMFNYIPHQAVFIKRTVFNKYGLFDEQLKSMMDQELWLRINYDTKWGFIDRVISNYRIHHNSVSSSAANYYKNRIEYKQVKRKYLTSYIDIILAKIASIIVESRRHITTR